ncbi:hypothetical protein LguiA_000736 [Lonicera macranthoides]
MTIGGLCDLDLIVVKATSPDDMPLPERYVRDLLKIFSISPSSYRAFSISFTRRFSKTQCWRVALKCLLLLHRLLRALPDNTPFRTELLCARSNRFLSLYPCHFRDLSSSASEDYTMFVRSYAQLIDEAIDCLSIDFNDKHSEEEDVHQNLPDKMKDFGGMLEALPQVQSITDRVMDCRPTGAAAQSFIIQSAMKYIIRDSFICYTTFRREIVVLLDHLIQMPYRCSVAAFAIYKKAALQANQLCEFYDWCKSMGICGLYEYPFIDRIPEIQIQALENFLDGMWQLTESSSSTTSPLTTKDSSPTSSKEENGDKQLMRPETFAGYNWAKSEENDAIKKTEKDEEREPLIQLDVVDHKNGDWESLLEASICPSWKVYETYFGSDPNEHLYARNSVDGGVNEAKDWQMQVYNPSYVNPFSQTQNFMPLYQESFSGNPTNPWVL